MISLFIWSSVGAVILVHWFALRLLYGFVLLPGGFHWLRVSLWTVHRFDLGCSFGISTRRYDFLNSDLSHLGTRGSVAEQRALEDLPHPVAFFLPKLVCIYPWLTTTDDQISCKLNTLSRHHSSHDCLVDLLSLKVEGSMVKRISTQS